MTYTGRYEKSVASILLCHERGVADHKAAWQVLNDANDKLPIPERIEVPYPAMVRFIAFQELGRASRWGWPSIEIPTQEQMNLALDRSKLAREQEQQKEQQKKEQIVLSRVKRKVPVRLSEEQSLVRASDIYERRLKKETLKSIGKSYGICGQSVRQIYDKEQRRRLKEERRISALPVTVVDYQGSWTPQDQYAEFQRLRS